MNKKPGLKPVNLFPDTKLFLQNKQNAVFTVTNFYLIKEALVMEVFETILAGTDGLINGLVSTTAHFDSSLPEYTFSSLDGSLTLVVAKDENGLWKRVSSTEPYLSGWVEELGEQIDQHISADL